MLNLKDHWLIVMYYRTLLNSAVHDYQLMFSWVVIAYQTYLTLTSNLYKTDQSLDVCVSAA